MVLIYSLQKTIDNIRRPQEDLRVDKKKRANRALMAVDDKVQ